MINLSLSFYLNEYKHVQLFKLHNILSFYSCRRCTSPLVITINCVSYNNNGSDISISDREDENEALYNAANTPSKENNEEYIASFNVNDAPKKRRFRWRNMKIRS